MCKKPNIVYVFADQLRYTALGSSGNGDVRTPSFDLLAAQGMAMDQAFSSCPICSPYRAQILTGLYAHQNGVVCNEYEMRRDVPTLPQVLRDNGYATAYVGKWHLGYGPYTEEKRYGFDYMAANNMPRDAYHAEVYKNEEGPFRMGDNWLPAEETDMAAEYIRRHQQEAPEQPFMLMMSWIPPHWPYKTYPDKYAVYDPQALKLPENIPAQMAAFEREELAMYYGNITGLDDQFGRLMQTLAELGMEEDTIVCFSSDHGDHLGAHGFGKPADKWLHHSKRGSKATPYDESLHVPFIIRWPGHIKAGQRSDVIFNSVDVMPSLLALCGIQPPETLAGRDLSFAFTGEQGDAPDSAFFQILGPGWPHRGPWLGYWRGVRTHRYVYARWHEADYAPVLFDVLNDPLEENNLWGNPDYAGVRADLEQKLQEWLLKTRDPFDYGPRDPETGMLMLGQRFTHEKWVNWTPKR